MNFLNIGTTSVTKRFEFLVSTLDCTSLFTFFKLNIELSIYLVQLVEQFFEDNLQAFAGKTVTQTHNLC